MGQSIDYRQLELVSQFSKLLTLLGKPEELQKIIKDAKNILDENKALLGPLATKEKADLHLQRAEVMLEETKEQVKREFAAVDAQVESMRANAEKDRVLAADALASALKHKADCAALEESVQKNLAEVEALKQVLVAKAQVLAQEIATAVEQQEALRVKQEKLQKVLGE
jgi:hypothetical protein